MKDALITNLRGNAHGYALTPMVRHIDESQFDLTAHSQNFEIIHFVFLHHIARCSDLRSQGRCVDVLARNVRPVEEPV